MGEVKEINDTNYFNYIEKHHAEELALMKLQREQRLHAKRETLARITTMTNTIIENNKAIERNCKFVEQNKTYLLNIEKEDREFIRLDFGQHQNFKNSIEGIRKIFACSGIVLDKINDINHKPVQVAVKMLNRECDEVEITHNNCVALTNHLKELIDITNQREKDKDECNILSESTVHTFQFTNLSASSPNNT